MEPEDSLHSTAINATLSHIQHSQLQQWLWEGFKGVFWQLLYPVAGQIPEQTTDENVGRMTNKVSRLSKIHSSFFFLNDFLKVMAARKAGAFKCYFVTADGIKSGYFLSLCVQDTLFSALFIIRNHPRYTFTNYNKNPTKLSQTKLRSTQKMSYYACWAGHLNVTDSWILI